MNGSAALGIIGLDLVGGHGELTLGVSLDASTTGSVLDLDVVPSVSGSANVTLPVQLAARIGAQ